jgi:hypothetical protein
MTKNSKNIWYSITLGIFLTAITWFIGIKCGAGETGGVNEGWRGLPIPYYQCGVWGDTISKITRCVQGMIIPQSSCIWESFLSFLILLIDIAFWSFISYLGIKKFGPTSHNSALA